MSNVKRLQQMDHVSNRYAGKPFLRLLDRYVLDAIVQLTDEQRQGFLRIEQKLKAVYNVSGSWQEIVRIQMDLPDTFRSAIRKLWDGYLYAANNQGVSVHPHEFAERFVDENFPEIFSHFASITRKREHADKFFCLRQQRWNRGNIFLHLVEYSHMTHVFCFANSTKCRAV